MKAVAVILNHTGNYPGILDKAKKSQPTNSICE